jgi:Mlc titration factor MtfA (ptsG expression regulator)
MLRFLRVWRRRRRLRRHRIAASQWQRCVQQLPALSHLSGDELWRLRDLASLFLLEKTITGAQQFEVDSDMRALIAAQAALLILNLDLDYYNGWYEIVVYPDTFVVDHEEHDAAGVVHESRRELGGEAWSHGPVVLSWADAEPGVQPHGPGSNVVIHEFAHKLDMLNGDANGMPPLHRGMDRAQWTDVMTRAYERLCHAVDQDLETSIDPYASESPAEFFAVLSEVFFEFPEQLSDWDADAYRQFSLFYRQDPLATAGRTRPDDMQGPT